MQPTIIVNWGAILICVVSGFAIGFVWYGPLFGRAWAACMGLDFDKKPDAAVMRRAVILQAVGLLLVSFVLSHSNQIWRRSVWGLGVDDPAYVYALFGAGFTWLGFYVPMQLNKVAWENRPWKLFFINAGHDLVNLIVISMILAIWR